MSRVSFLTVVLSSAFHCVVFGSQAPYGGSMVAISPELLLPGLSTAGKNIRPCPGTTLKCSGNPLLLGPSLLAWEHGVLTGLGLGHVFCPQDERQSLPRLKWTERREVGSLIQTLKYRYHFGAKMGNFHYRFSPQRK